MKYVIVKSSDCRKSSKYWNIYRQKFDSTEPSLFLDPTLCLRCLLSLVESGVVKYEDIEFISIEAVDL